MDKATQLKESVINMARDAYKALSNPKLFHEIELGDGAVADIVIEYSRMNMSLSLTCDAVVCDECRTTIEDLGTENISIKEGFENNLLDLIDKIRAILINCRKKKHTSDVVDLTEKSEDKGIQNASRTSILVSGKSQQAPPPEKGEKTESDILYIGMSTRKENEITEEGPEIYPDSTSKNFSVAVEYIVQQSRVNMVILSKVCNEMKLHAEESNLTRKEIGGLLIGNVREIIKKEKGIGFWITVTDIIRFDSVNTSVSHLTIDEEVWRKTESIFQKLFAHKGKQKIGWYHTHPHQGVFFSGSDWDVHSIFQKVWQVALVIDPRTYETGFFYWDDYRKKLGGDFLFSLEQPQRRSDSSLQRFFLSKFWSWTLILLLVAPIVWGLIILPATPSYYLKATILGLGCAWTSSHIFLIYELKKYLKGRRSSVFLFLQNYQKTLMIILLTMLSLFGISFAWWLAGNSVRLPESIFGAAPGVQNTPPANIDSNRAAVQNVRVEIPPAPVEGTIVLDGGKLKITVENRVFSYSKDYQDWKPDEPRQERDYFKDSLKINIGDNSKEVHSIQKSCGLRPDGDWGKDTRNAFLEKILLISEQGQKQFVLTSNGTDVLFSSK